MCTFETPIRGGTLALASRFTRATWVALGMLVTPACTLITNVDREKIPVQEQPSFPRIDSGIEEDAAVPPGDGDPDAAVDGDAGGDAVADAAPGDAEAPSGDAGDASPTDAN